MKKESCIFVAGAHGLVGSAIVRILQNNGYKHILTPHRNVLDLCDEHAISDFFGLYKPEYVFLAAASVGGIKANSTYPALFIYNNLKIELNVIHAAYMFGVKKLLFLGSSCIYPRECVQPIREEYLLTGPLEPTNKSYAIAKIAGLQLCHAYNTQYNTCFISCMPTNLYGPYDNFDLKNSHVLPALIRKIHTAKEKKQSSVLLWGSGKPRREFLYVDDLAQACLFLMLHYRDNEPINIGTGQDITIAELAHNIKDIVGYNGVISFNNDGLDGTPQKLLDVHKIKKLGWRSRTSLQVGIKDTYDWYLTHYTHINKNSHRGQVSEEKK